MMRATQNKADTPPPGHWLLRTQKGNRVLVLALPVLLVAGVAVVKFTHFFEWVTRAGLLFCPFHEVTGLNCPGCGGTRAVMSLLRPDFFRALYYNPLTMLFGLYMIWWFVRLCINAFGRRFVPVTVELVQLRHLLLPAIVLFAFWVVRNLPWYRQWFF